MYSIELSPFSTCHQLQAVINVIRVNPFVSPTIHVLGAQKATFAQIYTCLPIQSTSDVRMPRNYLPVYSGMPSPVLSAHPANLTSLSAVEEFLAGTPFASRSITDLVGGTINYVYRIHLLTPFEGSQTVVLKHAQPFWKGSTGTCWEVERQVNTIIRRAPVFD